MSIDPSTPTQGAPATVTVDVKNLGNSPSGEFVTSWNPSAFEIIVPGEQTETQETESLEPGEERELHFTFVYPKAGNYRSIADVNAFNTVKETNTANNEEILNVTVNPAQIDLVFTTPITSNPNPLVFKEAGTESFKVRNNGPIATGSFAVQLTPQEKGITQTKTVPGLNVGEETTLTYNVKYNKAGNYTATAVIDPTNQVVKTVTPDEESSTITVAPIDLGFVGPIVVSPSPMISKEEGTESVTVKDFGPGATGGSFAVTLTPQAKGFKQTKIVPELKSGEQVTLTFPVEYAKPGSYTATAAIDPSNQVDKTVTPDEQSQGVTVEPKSASVNVKLKTFKPVTDPHGYQEWRVSMIVYDKGASCSLETVIGELGEGQEPIKNVACAGTGSTYEENYVNGGEGPLAANLSVGLHLEEEAPIVAASLGISFDRGGIITHLEDIGIPGIAPFLSTRSDYIHPSGPKTVDGKACFESNGTEVNKGNCYNAEFETELLGHVGSNVITSKAAEKRATSTVNQALAEITELAKKKG